ncbi:MAG TPA: hypothetical protein VN541_19610, partial [Tepidisphaeraceae bacterium]|nr:hypothetical protein [Tepidisphaeraceae bacterium]
GPLGMNLLAAAAQRFPFDGSRVTVYLAPAILLLSGAGSVAIIQWADPRVRKVAMVPAVAMVLTVAAMAAYSLVVPRDRGHIRPAVEFVRRHAQPNDTIYALLYHEFECYWPKDDPRVQTELPPASRIPTKRFWIVWSFPNQRVLHRLDSTLQWAGSFARRKLTFVGHGGSAYLFEIDRAPPDLEPPDMSTHHKMMNR